MHSTWATIFKKNLEAGKTIQLCLSGTNDEIKVVGKTFSINGCGAYSLDDLTAAEKIPEKYRYIFWGVCSDEAKKSELYNEFCQKNLNIRR